jgi:hypothetical protein
MERGWARIIHHLAVTSGVATSAVSCAQYLPVCEKKEEDLAPLPPTQVPWSEQGPKIPVTKSPRRDLAPLPLPQKPGVQLSAKTSEEDEKVMTTKLPDTPL